MKRNPVDYPGFAPLLLWIDLATKSAEMMLASAQVIGHRAARLAVAGPVPGAQDRREFERMGQEKLEASAQSGRAMAAHMVILNPQLGARAFSSMLRSFAALTMLATSRTPAQVFARHAALAQAMGQTAARFAEVSNSATRLAHRGLAPIHAKATANAKRLGKR